MGKPRVLILKDLPEQAKQYIAEHCDIVEIAPDLFSRREGILQHIAGVEGMLQTDVQIDSELLNKAPQLKIVSNVSVGYNNFDIHAMKAHGVIGTHTPHVLDDTVADLVFALILATARRVPELDHRVKQGMWGLGGGKAEDHFGIDVHHATIGIIGMGRIGEAIAKRASHGFDMKVLYSNRSRKQNAEETYGAQYRTMEQLLCESDFVVLMTPLTPETNRMIRKEHFEKMKRTAVFINASRGQLVDEQALIEVLEQKLIYGAGLDVFEREPIDPNNPLLKFSNVVTSPHIGSATAKTRFDMAMAAAHNLVAGLIGEVPSNIVPELKLYKSYT